MSLLPTLSDQVWEGLSRYDSQSYLSVGEWSAEKSLEMREWSMAIGGV